MSSLEVRVPDIGDFESVDVAKRLSLFFGTWNVGSLPSESEFDFTTIARARWYTYAASANEITPGSQGLDQGDNLFVVRLEPQGETPLDRMRSWSSIQNVISTTGEDYTRQGKEKLFNQLSRFLSTQTDAGDYDTSAAALGMTPGAVTTAVNRLRSRYGDFITAEIARTVGTAEEIPSERRYICELLCLANVTADAR